MSKILNREISCGLWSITRSYGSADSQAGKARHFLTLCWSRTLLQCLKFASSTEEETNGGDEEPENLEAEFFAYFVLYDTQKDSS